MTELVITSTGDSWVNSGKPGQNYGSANRVQVQSGSRYGFVRPHLGSVAGRTVLDAYLVGRSAGTVAQTVTVAPVSSRWAPGQVSWANQPTVNAAAAVSTAIPALSDGGVFTLTGLAAMVQAVADGTDYYGFRLTTSAGSNQRFYSVDSGAPAWELHVELSDAPEQPTGLRPDGGAVSDASPILAWDFLDLG